MTLANNIQVHLKKIEYREKLHFFFFTYFKKWNFHIYFTFITCKVRHLLLVLIPCFIKSRVNAAIYQEILERFLLPSAEKLYGDTDFIFQQEFSTCPQYQNHSQSGLLTMILLSLIVQQTCLTWTPYGTNGIFSRESWETVDPTIQTSWRLNSATGRSLPCHTSLMLACLC